jgi:Tfp pilus assembly protein FimT
MRQTEFVSVQRRGQAGLSLLGLLFWAVLLAFTGVVAARVFPTVLEFYTIQSAVNRIAASNPATVPAVRADFDRAQQIEYSIVSISSKDLVVSKDNDKLQISFAYEKQIELGGPVYLLIKYEGRSR